MKTWRERNAEARTRGYFASEDITAWTSLVTCPAGEYAAAYGLNLEANPPHFNVDLHLLGNGLWDLMYARDFDGVERLLDQIEDRALQLKREATA